jgi:hypothetical protein
VGTSPVRHPRGKPETKGQRGGSLPCDWVPAIPAGTTVLGYRNPLGMTMSAQRGNASPDALRAVSTRTAERCGMYSHGDRSPLSISAAQSPARHSGRDRRNPGPRTVGGGGHPARPGNHGGQPETKRQRAGSPPGDGVPAIPAGTTALGYRNPLGITMSADRGNNIRRCFFMDKFLT